MENNAGLDLRVLEAFKESNKGGYLHGIKDSANYERVKSMMLHAALEALEIFQAKEDVTFRPCPAKQEQAKCEKQPTKTEYEEVLEEDYVGPAWFDKTDETTLSKGNKVAAFIKQGEQKTMPTVSQLSTEQLVGAAQNLLLNLGSGRLEKAQYSFDSPNMLYMILTHVPLGLSVCYQLDRSKGIDLDALIGVCIDSFDGMISTKERQEGMREVFNTIRPKVLK